MPLRLLRSPKHCKPPVLNFVLGSANEAVLSWGPGRAKGIFELMRAYAETGEYAGHLDVTAMSRTAPA